jgi:hypothetical protein
MTSFKSLIILMSRFLGPKVKFEPREDALLIEAVQTHGTGDWSLVASMVNGRNARQCRERWNNYVNPALTHTDWTSAEDELLIEKYGELGPKWHKIAGCFEGRAKNNVRNRFHAIQRRKARQERPEAAAREKAVMAVNEDIAEMAAKQTNADAASHDPLAFLDAAHQQCGISWQTDLDPEFSSCYFF